VKKHNLIFICFLVGMATVLFAADPPREMRLLLARGDKLIGSKGTTHGVTQGTKYDIIRQGPYGEERIGMAQVILSKSTKCGLRAMELQPGAQIKKGDLLRVVMSEEESILAEMEALLQEDSPSSPTSEPESESVVEEVPNQGTSDYGPPPQKYSYSQSPSRQQPVQEPETSKPRRSRPSTRIPYEDKPPMMVGFHGGIAMPLGPETFKEFWTMGFAANADFSYPITRLFSAMAGVGLSSLSFDEDGFQDYYNSLVGNWGGVIPGGTTANIQIDGPNFQIIELLLGVRFGQPYMGERFRFYLCAGPGYYFMDATFDNTGSMAGLGSYDLSDSKIGVWGGAEVFLGLTDKLALSLVPRYHMIMTEGDALSYLQATLGISYALR
jgi:hypothetical protein